MASPVAWLRPAPFDGSAASFAEHADAVAAMTRRDARLWLGPFDPPPALPEGLAETTLVVPTSGSTGRAKAVALSLAALTASQDATAEAIGDGLWLPLLPPTHIAGVQVLARACRAAAVRGLPRPLLPARLPALAAHFDAASFAAAAEHALDEADARGVPALTSLVPTQLSRLVGDDSGDGARARDLLARFAAVLVGGAATSPDLLARARDLGVAVRTTYGSSETAGGCVYDRRPLPGVALALLGADDGADDRAGEATTGRLAVASPSLALGYLGVDGSADTSAFAAAIDGRRAFATSDLARLDADGAEGMLLTVLGRADDVIITGGRKVLPQDVERAIREHPALAAAIAEVVVVGVPDAQWGQRLVAVIEARQEISAEALRDALRGAGLPGHAVPKDTLTVAALPRLGIGKIDRSGARDLAIARTSR